MCVCPGSWSQHPISLLVNPPPLHTPLSRCWIGEAVCVGGSVLWCFCSVCVKMCDFICAVWPVVSMYVCVCVFCGCGAALGWLMCCEQCWRTPETAGRSNGHHSISKMSVSLTHNTNQTQGQEAMRWDKSERNRDREREGDERVKSECVC